MPRDFKTFANENKKVIDENQKQAKSYENILNKYKDMDQSSLMNSLFQEASKLKSEGKLDNNSLSSLRSTLAPFLNNEQQEMLNNLINQLNEQK